MPAVFEGFDPWLIDGLVVPASLHDVEGRFVHMNAAAERASGCSNAEMLGHHFTEPLHPNARENVEAQFRRAVERREPTDFETVFVDANGGIRGVRAQHLPICRADKIVGVLILAYEVRTTLSRPVGRAPLPTLTPRQREMLNLIASGVSTSEIAKRLTLSSLTVRNHLQKLLAVLDAHTRLEAVATAQRLGLLAAPVLGPPDTDHVAIKRDVPNR